MKLNCFVSVVHHVQSSTFNNRSRKQNSSLSLVINPRDGDDPLLVHCTNQNNGIRYKVKDNIESVFTKCLSNGMATIRLKVPAVDLCIQCDSLQLSCFLKKLQLVLKGKDLKLLKLSTFSSSLTVAQNVPKEKLIIKKKNQYDTLSEFPRTLRCIQINNIMFSKLDARILKLQCLRILNLENNALETLPKEFGRLALQELNLNNNLLGVKNDLHDWDWLNGHNIKKTLKLLTIQNNKLSVISTNVAKLKKLVTLKLDKNYLCNIPASLGNLSELRYFTVSQNKLPWVPIDVLDLALTQVDFNNNNFIKLKNMDDHIYTNSTLYHKQYSIATSSYWKSCLSLVELSLYCVIKNRIRFSDGDIPITLQDYILNISKCICKKVAFLSNPYALRSYSLRTRSPLQFHSSENVIAKVHFCSFKCYTMAKGPSFQQVSVNNGELVVSYV